MMRFLAFCLGAVVLLAIVFGRAEETPAGVPPDGSAIAAASTEPETPPDPFTRLPHVLRLEAAVHELAARYSALMREVYVAWNPDGVFSDAEAAPIDRLRIWIEGAINELGPTVRDLRLTAVPPELTDYSLALHDYTLAMVRNWQGVLVAGDQDSIASALDDAALRLGAARARVLLDALPVGPSRDYIATFSEHLNGSDSRWAVESRVLANVFDDPQAWEARMAALESENVGLSALRPPREWADFHGRWSEALAAALEVYRLREPGQPHTANVGAAAAALADGSAARWALAAEWLTVVSAAVATAHPLSGQ